MKVSPERPFQIIYSLFEHEYLGYLFESFVVQLSDTGKLTYSHQNISAKNAAEFESGLDKNDFELIRIMDEIQQNAIANKFQRKKLKTKEFFLKTYDKDTGDQLLQNEIEAYIERRRSKILARISGKQLYEMGRDGEPTWKKIELLDTKATVLFHFRKNEENTHYFPTIKLNREKIEFYNNDSYLLCREPAWMVVKNQLFSFEKDVNGDKLRPFLKKKFILIPKNVEEKYYQKFVAPLIASFDVYAKGFEIKTERLIPEAVLTFSELASAAPATLFDETPKKQSSEQRKILFELSFQYGTYSYKADKLNNVSVSLEKSENQYIFHRVTRDTDQEKQIIEQLIGKGLPLKNSRYTLEKNQAISWINDNLETLHEIGVEVRQHGAMDKSYFLGETHFDIEISEGIDWFDIKALIQFGDYEIPFTELRKYVLKNQMEFKLPNGQYAVIPNQWVTEYSDLFAFSNTDDDKIQLNKIHVSLVKGLQDGNHAKVAMSKKLKSLVDFSQIEEVAAPDSFEGTLRPYQQAGFEWLEFLNSYGFGGCLADDMGLGKTVQTLTLLQNEKEAERGTSLLVMPTSLIYNWEMEAKKFTPKLKILKYTGSFREKDTNSFAQYDLILTSYGVARIDAQLLKGYYFNYIILDESQAIKNPDSIISRAIRELKSRRKLILTGTPIENSTMDLWSQMSFANPGLLGNQKYFREKFQLPIEKKKDIDRTLKLNALIKPFILRREKSQVAKDLPEKIENVQYCDMSEDQREIYNEHKELYRDQILDKLETEGVKSSQMILLEGLTKLRQIANHPRLINSSYDGDSGKFQDAIHMLNNALSKNHKILIFSQFVKHLKIFEEHIQAESIKYAYLDGSVKNRQAQVEKFQENEDVRLFLISLKAGGVGLNLTRADYVFLLDPWWNPAAEAQAVDRAHRIGQKNTVFTYKFIARDTVEEKILKLQQSKLKLVKDLITIEESFIKSLSGEDITKLFD